MGLRAAVSRVRETSPTGPPGPLGFVRVRETGVFGFVKRVLSRVHGPAERHSGTGDKARALMPAPEP